MSHYGSVLIRPAGSVWSIALAAGSFIALGGDLYATFPRARKVDDGKVLLSDVVVSWLRANGPAQPPEAGRWRRAPSALR